MILLVFTIGTLNLVLGFVLALLAGQGPPELVAALDRLLGRVERGSATPALAPASAIAQPLVAMLDDGAEESLDLAPDDEPYDDDIAELLHADTPEAWELNEKLIETSLLKLNIAMMKSGTRATEIDSRLRACRGQTDAETVRDCAARIIEDCETYLTEQSQAADKFRARIGELGQLSALGDQIEMSNLEQAAQIETTLSNVRHMDFGADHEAANQRLLDELSKLRAARHRLRDQQNIALLAIARQEGRLETLEPRIGRDSLTGLANRIGLEMTMELWWRQNRHQSRQLSAVLFDLDRFGELNDRFGTHAADRLLEHVGRLVGQSVGAADLAGRYDGQRFLLVLADVGPRQAIKQGEFLRQTLQRTTFTYDDQQLQLTASASYVGVLPEDGIQSLLNRLEATLTEAKQGGAGQACFHTGREVEPLQTPNLGAPYGDIRLDKGP